MPQVLKLLGNLRAVAAVCGTRTMLAFLRAILLNLPAIVRARN
jgi:hypothetical protein